jgi:hypothetical protein
MGRASRNKKLHQQLTVNERVAVQKVLETCANVVDLCRTMISEARQGIPVSAELLETGDAKLHSIAITLELLRQHFGE